MVHSMPTGLGAVRSGPVGGRMAGTKLRLSSGEVIRCVSNNQKLRHTLPETNIAPENWWLEDYLPFEMANFQIFRAYVGFWEGS